MLNFTIKLISDAGFQSEITSISTAAQQIEVFSRVLKTSIMKFLTHPEDTQKCIEECAVSEGGGLESEVQRQQTKLIPSSREWCVTDSTRTFTAKC